MKVNTLHCTFKFLNETNMEVHTSIAMQLPSTNFTLKSTAYEVHLPRRLLAEATRVVVEATEVRSKQEVSEPFNDQCGGTQVLDNAAATFSRGKPGQSFLS